MLQDDFTEEEQEEIDETAAEIEAENDQPITIGKKNPIPLSSITNIDLFKKHLEADVTKLTNLKNSLVQYEAEFNAGKADDDKLNKLIEHINTKQKKSDNKKILVFTVFKDTAKFLYDELKKKEFKNVAFVSGSISETFDGYSGDRFELILERFAPFTKLYNEKDWTELYKKENLSEDYKEADKWKVPYEKWLELITKHDKATLKKIDNPIDVLIATDCLSEGQNLQDCDLVINYDIHWNPVRLIQRMGRIDRIGSPNKTIKGINFWPGKNYEDYLRLKSRVENRMALMSVVGTELDDKMTPEFQRMVEENPLLPKQAQKCWSNCK
ncbi:MAG: SWF/SNF helicase family protein [Saprospiraceae bacterium]|nr:SWF/SNF helicase family protein [Saprospiraceae bacterium]